MHPNISLSISIIIYEIRNLAFSNAYFLFKYKDRENLNEKSITFNNSILNQYFNFKINSFSDILEIYLVIDNIIRKEPTISIVISNILNAGIIKQYYSIENNGSILMQTQLVPENIIPFSPCTYDPDIIFIQFLEGENLDIDSFYCSVKLDNDIHWKQVLIDNTIENPRLNKVIKLLKTDESKNLEILFSQDMDDKDISIKPFIININEIPNEAMKRICKFQKGNISFLIQKGKLNITPFEDYKEIEENKSFNDLTLGVKIVGVEIDGKSKNLYCNLELAKIERRTRAIYNVGSPKWNNTFYFEVPSYSTNELSIKCYNTNKNKKDILGEISIPIIMLKCGIIEDKWYGSFHIITHLIQPGKLSFIENPFKTTCTTINITNLNSSQNVFCLIKLKNDEYWRYTKIGNFSDYFIFNYIHNSTLSIKASDSKNISEEINLDLSQNKEQIINNSLGQFKIDFVNMIKPFSISSIWKCNIYVKRITNIVKNKDLLWYVEVNDKNTGFTYDGNIDKYVSININSLQSDEIKFRLFKIEKGSKKEYAFGSQKIYGIQIGIIEKKNISLSKQTLLNNTIIDNEIEINLHITPPNLEPFIENIYNPLIIHTYVIEALNIPKMDLMSKSDPYVVLRFEKDNIGVKTRALDNTHTPQWNELLDMIITDQKEKLIIEIWDKNIQKDKIINSIKLDIQKYLDGKPAFEWIKIDKILLNLAIHIKPLGEDFITQKEVDEYQLNLSLPI